MEKGKLSDASILRQPYGYDYLQRYTTFACGGEKERIALEDRLEWNCGITATPTLEDKIIQFRASGIRVKLPNFAPALNLVGTQIPIFPWVKLPAEILSEGEPNKGRYMTIREAAAIQGMQDLNFSSLSSTRTLEALGNAINVTLVRRIAKLLLNDEQQ